MPDEATDAIAQEAARLVAAGRAVSIRDAVKSAMSSGTGRDATPPSDQLVRDHLRAMAMQALGEQGYNQRVIQTMQTAEQIMTLLELSWTDCRTMLVGRAAAGNIDGGVTLHIRVHTDRSVTELASLLVDAGYDEPAFKTARTRAGRLSRLVVDVDQEVVTLTRVPHAISIAGDRDLFTDKPVKVANLDEVRRRLRDFQSRELSDPM